RQHFASGLARSERKPRNEGNVALLAEVEHVIPLAVGEAVAVLHGHDRDNFPCTFDVLLSHIRKTDQANLPFPLQLGECFYGKLKTCCWIRCVQLIKINALKAQALETAFESFPQMRGAGVVAPISGSWAPPSALGGDYEVFGIRGEGLCDEFLADIGSVGI